MTLVTNPVLVKRFAGTKSEKPMFKAFRDGKELFQEVIDGQPDVKPAFMRITTKVRKQFNVEVFPKGRDEQKLQTWSSERNSEDA